MIALAAAGPRAARLTFAVLLAAGVRAALLPFGEGVSTGVFVACLLGVAATEGWRRETDAWRLAPAVLAGIAVGGLLLFPAALNGWSGRGVGPFITWGAIAGLVATVEEVVVRGVLQRQWAAEASTGVAILISALVFAVIHLPRYGLAAMPLDLAVGLTLAGLRALTGRVLPCAIAHTLADWGAWFLA